MQRGDDDGGALAIENIAPLGLRNREKRRKERKQIGECYHFWIQCYLALVVGMHVVPHGGAFYGVQVCDCTCSVSFLENSGKVSRGLGMCSFLFQKILVLGLGS